MVDAKSGDKISLSISGMTCANCAMSIERSLKKLNGINGVNVNFATEQATVFYDSTPIRIQDIIRKINELGEV